MDRERLVALNLVFKDYEDLGLRIIKYKKNHSEMDDEFVRSCRGMIVDINTNKIICMPPIKSMNTEEYNSLNYTNDSVIEEFIDGTMINMWYYNECWHISTRSSIGANCKWFSDKKFNELFEESNALNIDAMNTEYFYSFVLQHPENRIVTCYSEPKITLVFVGKVNEDNTVESIPYEDIAYDINVSIPQSYQFEENSSIEALIEYVNKKDYEFQGVVLKNGIHRTKIRNPNYNYARQLKGNTRNMKYLYFDLLKTGKMGEYLNFYPEFTQLFNIFSSEFSDMAKNLHQNYMNYHVRKSVKDIKEIYFPFRPHTYNLHKLFLENRSPVTPNVVSNYLNTLEPAQIVYIINYKFYKKN